MMRLRTIIDLCRLYEIKQLRLHNSKLSFKQSQPLIWDEMIDIKNYDTVNAPYPNPCQLYVIVLCSYICKD